MNKKTLLNVQQFLKNNSRGIFVIYGPTWCWKTNTSLELAKFLQQNGYIPFIISADSRQIYQEMNIGTGKILPHEMENIPHIWLDLISPKEIFSVVDFQKSIDNCSLFKEWKKWNKKYIPIICWWTGLYIDSIIFERNYLWSKPNPIQREELEQFRLKHGNEALWKKLYEIDPKYASILHPNNHTYIIRWIEIFLETWKSKLDTEDLVPKLQYPTFFLTPYTDNDENRKILYQKINSRIDEMFKSGLVKEVKKIINHYGINCPGLKTIGYKEIVEFLLWNTSIEEAQNLIAQHNRNYAKRQITWNKKKYDTFINE